VVNVQHVDSACCNDKGAKQLVKGDRIALRFWEADKGSSTDDSSRDREYQAHHESVGYCLEGKAELTLEGQKLVIEQGQSWLVPPNARHTYKVIAGPFKAVEATADPATL
jgi:quercetin dioxygenase-like cupin family protein